MVTSNAARGASPLWSLTGTVPSSPLSGIDMLLSAGVRVYQQEANRHPPTLAALAQAGFPLNSADRSTRLARGGDILLWGLDPRDPTKPTVLDITVVSERARVTRGASTHAEHAEAKKRAKHGPMYSAVHYDFHGVAFEVGGALGPSARTLLLRARDVWESRRGKGARPPNADWSCPGFVAYWRSRIVSALQCRTAVATLTRARRMGEIRRPQSSAEAALPLPGL